MSLILTAISSQSRNVMPLNSRSPSQATTQPAYSSLIDKAQLSSRENCERNYTLWRWLRSHHPLRKVGNWKKNPHAIMMHQQTKLSSVRKYGTKGWAMCHLNEWKESNIGKKNSRYPIIGPLENRAWDAAKAKLPETVRRRFEFTKPKKSWRSHIPTSLAHSKQV